jgi:hypothetical protein
LFVSFAGLAKDFFFPLLRKRMFAERLELRIPRQEDCETPFARYPSSILFLDVPALLLRD